MQQTTRGVDQTRYPISETEGGKEKAVIAALGSHFVNMTGTMRQAYDEMTAVTPIADGITLSKINQHGLTGWWVQPQGASSDKVILFLHGGAYMLGSAKAYRGFASQLAVRTGVSTFVLDYPLAPEHPFPAAFDSAVAARQWLGTQGYSQIALVGDSAGGGLALASMAHKGDRAQIRAVIVFSPWIDLAFTGDSFNDPTTYDPIFTSPQILRNAASTYLAGADPMDSRASPLFSIPDAIAPLLIQVGSDELLLDDARRYAEAAAGRGGEVTLSIYEGLHHVFQRSITELEGARHAMDAAASFADGHWRACSGVSA